MYDAQFSVLRVIILVMVLLSVVNSVNMTVFERVGEFGTMMALGNRGRVVFGLIVAENSLLGFTGSVLGVSLGVFLAWAISAVGIPMPPPPNADLNYIAHIRMVPSIVRCFHDRADCHDFIALSASCAGAYDTRWWTRCARTSEDVVVPLQQKNHLLALW